MNSKIFSINSEPSSILMGLGILFMSSPFILKPFPKWLFLTGVIIFFIGFIWHYQNFKKKEEDKKEEEKEWKKYWEETNHNKSTRSHNRMAKTFEELAE